MVNAYRKALQSLWTGVCTVYVRVPSPTPDPATGRTVWAVEAVAEDATNNKPLQTASCKQPVLPLAVYIPPHKAHPTTGHT